MRTFPRQGNYSGQGESSNNETFLLTKPFPFRERKGKFSAQKIDDFGNLFQAGNFVEEN